MREEVIFRMESAYREDFEVKSYHFGGPEKTMCIARQRNSAALYCRANGSNIKAI